MNFGAMKGITIAFIAITSVLVLVGIVFTCLLIASPKLRGKLMSKQIKATKYMVDETKDDLTHLANVGADISSEAITKTTRAIKKGLSDTKFCKHCGTEIDVDSKFCNSCGKEQ